MNIDIERLKWDAEYWDEVKGAVPGDHYDKESGFFCDEKCYYSEHGFKPWIHVNPIKQWPERFISRPTKPAAPEIMDDTCLAARIGEIGNQIHNLGCEHQNNEDLSDSLGKLACALWDLAGHAPKESAAPEWDGEGYPPVGCSVKFWFNSAGAGYWQEGVVIAQDGDMTVAKVNGAYYGRKTRGNLIAPICTQADRDREKLIEVCKVGGTAHWLASDIADAIIAAGYRKQ